MLGGLGGFGGAFAIPAGYREPCSSRRPTASGTKTAIAPALGRFDTSASTSSRCAPTTSSAAGAEPLFFLDYIAVGRLDPAGVAELVGGVAAGCREAGCALVGGETAEHPGLMDADDVRPGRLLHRRRGARPAHRRLGGRGPATRSWASPSSGLHANGFSLVRSLIAQWDLDLAEPYQEQLRLTLGDAGRTRRSRPSRTRRWRRSARSC